MPFPRISTAYKCDVAANFEEHGYTLAYQENYDKAQGKLLTKGRFLPSNTFEMIDQKTNWLYQWSGDGSDCKSCTSACMFCVADLTVGCCRQPHCGAPVLAADRFHV